MKPFCILWLCFLSLAVYAQVEEEQYAVNDSVLLQEVIVKADKKLVTLKADRYVVDATQIRNGKVNLNDLVRDVPGVMLDKNHISILGKGGVKIMINGRLKLVSDDQVMNLLKSYNASEVQKVEVIYNTGAEFDAAGNYGILNFIMSKPKQDFVGGDLSNSFTVSDYASNETNLNLKYNRKKFISFLSVGYHTAKEYGWQTNNFYYTGLTRDSRSETWDWKNEWKTRLGMDYSIDDRSTVSLEGSFSNNRGKYTSTDQIHSDYLSSPNDIQLSSSFRKLPQRYWDLSFFIDREWNDRLTTTGIVEYYNRREKQNYTFSSDQYDPEMNLLADDYYHFLNNEYRHLKGISYSLDLTWKLPLEYQLKAGTKGSFSDVANESLYDYSNLDTQNNLFAYDEDCFTAYWVLTRTYFKCLDMRLGGRYEHTFVQGVSNQTQTNKNDYGRLFPDINLSYRLKESNQLSVFYRGGIIRPWMSYLNPYRLYASPYVANEGTPELRPNYFNKVELAYQRSFKNGFLKLTGSYSAGNDEIAEVSHMTEEGTTLYKWANAFKQNDWGLGYMFYYGGLSWMKMTLMGNMTHNNPETINGYTGCAVKSTRFFNMMQLSFIFDRERRFTGSLTGSISTPKKTPFMKSDGSGWLRGGVNYMTSNKKWNIGLYVYNIIPIETSGTYYSTEGMTTCYHDHSFRTSACLTLSYTFGKDIREKYKSSSSSDVKERF